MLKFGGNFLALQTQICNGFDKVNGILTKTLLCRNSKIGYMWKFTVFILRHTFFETEVVNVLKVFLLKGLTEKSSFSATTFMPVF